MKLNQSESSARLLYDVNRMNAVEKEFKVETRMFSSTASITDSGGM